MTYFLLFFVAILFLYIGNKAFSISFNKKKQTDPPSDVSQIDYPQIVALGLALFAIGVWLLYVFAKMVL